MTRRTESEESTEEGVIRHDCSVLKRKGKGDIAALAGELQPRG